MFLKVSLSDTKVLASEDDKDQIVNHPVYKIHEDGNIQGKIKDASYADFLESNVFFTDYYVKVARGCLDFIVIPACSLTELYYCAVDDELLISDNFYELSKKVGIELIDNYNYFLKKSYCRPSETLNKKISRFNAGSIYRIDCENLVSQALKYKKESSSTNLSQALNSVLTHSISSQKVGVLFSGGADSLSLAIQLESANIPFTLYIGRFLPEIFENLEDVENARAIAQAKEWDLKIIDIDYRDYSTDVLEPMVYEMPNTSHFSLIFLKITEKMNNDGIDVCLSGQNVDNLYNYGATARFSFSRSGFIDLARRYLSSDMYAISLGQSFIKFPLTNIVSYILLISYNLMRRSLDYRLPRSKRELVENFTNSSDNVIFGKGNAIPDSNASNVNVREEILAHRIHSYLSSGDCRVIINACKLNNITPLLPYSSESMIPFFIGLNLGFKDVMSPKRQIYDLINKENAYLLKLRKRKVPNAISKYHSWAENDFPTTKFANEITSAAASDNLISFPTRALSLSYSFSKFWKKKVEEILNTGKPNEKC